MTNKELALREINETLIKISKLLFEYEYLPFSRHLNEICESYFNPGGSDLNDFAIRALVGDLKSILIGFGSLSDLNVQDKMGTGDLLLFKQLRERVYIQYKVLGVYLDQV